VASSLPPPKPAARPGRDRRTEVSEHYARAQN